MGLVKHNYGNVDDAGEDLKLTADGSILVAGKTVTVTYNYSALLMKFTPDGEVDTAFGTAGAVEEDLADFDYAWNVELQADGKIIIAGTSGVGPPNGFDLAVWKYASDGTADAAFGTNGLAHYAIGDYYTMIYGLDVQADGKILIGGQARTANNENYFFTARLQNDIASGLANASAPAEALVFPNPASVGSMVISAARAQCGACRPDVAGKSYARCLSTGAPTTGYTRGFDARAHRLKTRTARRSRDRRPRRVTAQGLCGDVPHSCDPISTPRSIARSQNLSRGWGLVSRPAF
ncbi:MAG: hypothetical protein IPH53_16370 [Flavobacteriales bacterium]|nr:hypothetical protein [Flavobacteriales bacterium]